MGGFLLNIGVEFMAVKCLSNIAQDTLQMPTLFQAEEVTSLAMLN